MLFKEAALRAEPVYAVPGSPEVLEDTTKSDSRAGTKKAVEVKVLPGVSFLDQVLAEIKFDGSAAWTLQRAIGFDGLPD